MGTFKEQYAKMNPGPAREALVYQYAIQQGKPKLVPITVPGPNNTKITYEVMPDFFMIDGIRVSLSPYNAQRIADHFGMRIPTTKMADQIYRNSNPIAAKPFSGSGAIIDGKHRSSEEFTQNLIGNSKANIAYSEQVDAQIAAAKNLDPNKPIDGFAKYITQSDIPGRASLYGLWSDPSKQQTSKAIQGGSGLTPHGIDQVEYCTYGRFAGTNVTITKADGTKINTTLDKVLTTPNLSATITHSPGKGTQRYTDHKAGPPVGYRGAKLDPVILDEAQSKAKELLNKPMWTEVSLTLSNGKNYIAKVEPHSNAPKGVSIYESISQKPIDAVKTTSDIKPTNQPSSVKKTNIIEKIRKFLDTLSL
jgi:hypothetical protein